MMSRRDGREDGSLLVELTVLTPLLFALALCILAFGRVSEARQEVVEASRAGAQAAVVLPNRDSAVQGAAASAVVSLFSEAGVCGHPQVSTDVSHFYPGGYVTVSVTCQVPLSDLSAPGVPGSTTIRGSATAPIDPYRSVA